MDASFIHQKVNSDYYGESTWKNHYDAFNQTAHRQAINGNPQALEFMRDGPRKFSCGRSKSPVQTELSIRIVEVFEQAGNPNNPPIDYLIIWGAANIHLLSPNLCDGEGSNIPEISFQRPNRADIFYILTKPFQIRAALLSLWTLTTYVAGMMNYSFSADDQLDGSESQGHLMCLIMRFRVGDCRIHTFISHICGNLKI